MDIKCVFLGECVHRDYEYTFYFNNEEYKTNNCFNNFYGYSSCEYNGKTYKNVSYESEIINETKIKSIGLFDIIFPYFILFFVLYTIKLLFKKFIKIH